MKKNDLNQMKSNVQKNRLTGLCRKACYVLPTIFLVVFFLSVNLTVHADEKTDSTGEVINYGYVEFDMPVAPRIVPDEEDALMASNLPTSYDARQHGQVTSVKNQNPYGTCWSFSSVSVLESSLLSNHVMSNPDLSELHLIRYSFINLGDDPLGGTKGDKLTYTGSNMMFEGGNGLVNFHAWANWRGAVPESYAPYSGNAGGTSMDDAYNHDSVHLQQFYRINWYDTNYVKQAIMDNGGVDTSLYFSYAYLNKRTGGYFTNLPADTTKNHAISIVGWDDNYSRSNFDINPGMDGAWLVKNSWGTSFGQNGYCWVSYAEKTFHKECAVYVGERADNYDNNYQYDGCYISTYTSPSGDNRSVANVFTIQGDRRQELKAVAIELYSAQTKYQVQIYKNLTDLSDPESGIPLLETPVSGETKHAGYYTIPLPDGVMLDPGTVFSVVVSFPGSGPANVAVEHSYSWNNTTYEAAALPNQSFVTVGKGWWSDYGKNNNANLRIKAFTVNKEAAVLPNGIGLNVDSLVIERGQTKKLTATVTPANATDKSVVFVSSTPNFASVDQNGNVTGHLPGTAYITAKTINGITKTIPVKVIVSPTNIFLNTNSATMYFGNEMTLTATLLPSNTTEKDITWTISNKNIGSVNGGVVKVWGAGVATVTARTVNGLTDQCVITVLADDNPDNPFADVKYDSWQYKAARPAYDSGFMTGKGTLAGRVIFSPDTNITRSQFVTALYSFDGKPATEYDNLFDDVPDGMWYSIPITWAAMNGVVAGNADGTFGVDGKATRQQLALMFYKYASYKGYDVKVPEEVNLDHFTDAATVESWAYEAVRWAVYREIISGKGNAKDGYRIDPKKPATRAECAAMLNKFKQAYPVILTTGEYVEEPIALPMEETEDVPMPEEETEDIIDDEGEPDDIVNEEEEKTDEEIKDENISDNTCSNTVGISDK